MSKWRAVLERKHGRGVAHKTFRVWRTFWKIMLGMKVARTADPSLGIRNRAPAPRWQRWSEGEVVRLVKTAWRSGYQGIACIIAVAGDEIRRAIFAVLAMRSWPNRSFFPQAVQFDERINGD
jgi:hypothetical protein